MRGHRKAPASDPFLQCKLQYQKRGRRITYPKPESAAQGRERREQTIEKERYAFTCQIDELDSSSVIVFVVHADSHVPHISLFALVFFSRTKKLHFVC
jgi:hypothetical protein